MCFTMETCEINMNHSLLVLCSCIARGDLVLELDLLAEISLNIPSLYCKASPLRQN